MNQQTCSLQGADALLGSNCFTGQTSQTSLWELSVYLTFW